MASSNDIEYILVFNVKEDNFLFLKHYLLLFLDNWFLSDPNVNMKIFWFFFNFGAKYLPIENRDFSFDTFFWKY